MLASLNKVTLVVMVVSILTFVGVFHEVAHGIVGILYGNQLLGIYIGFPASYAILQGSNLDHSFIYFSGGFTDFMILFVLWLTSWYSEKVRLSFGEKAWLLFVAIWRIVYAFLEMRYF